MRKFAFISRHVPTAEQIKIAAEHDIEIVHVGDMDGFNTSIDDFDTNTYQGAIVVHAALALRFAKKNITVGIFENEMRAKEGERPTFLAKSLHLYS